MQAEQNFSGTRRLLKINEEGSSLLSESLKGVVLPPLKAAILPPLKVASYLKYKLVGDRDSLENHLQQTEATLKICFLALLNALHNDQNNVASIEHYRGENKDFSLKKLGKEMWSKYWDRFEAVPTLIPAFAVMIVGGLVASFVAELAGMSNSATSTLQYLTGGFTFYVPYAHFRPKVRDWFLSMDNLLEENGKKRFFTESKDQEKEIISGKRELSRAIGATAFVVVNEAIYFGFIKIFGQSLMEHGLDPSGASIVAHLPALVLFAVLDPFTEHGCLSVISRTNDWLMERGPEKVKSILNTADKAFITTSTKLNKVKARCTNAFTKAFQWSTSVLVQWTYGSKLQVFKIEFESEVKDDITIS